MIALASDSEFGVDLFFSPTITNNKYDQSSEYKKRVDRKEGLGYTYMNYPVLYLCESSSHCCWACTAWLECPGWESQNSAFSVWKNIRGYKVCRRTPGIHCHGLCSRHREMLCELQMPRDGGRKGLKMKSFRSYLHILYIRYWKLRDKNQKIQF